MKEATSSSLIVSIVNQSACSACHAKGACTIADTARKEIEIEHSGRSFVPGQEVTVILQESQGLKALFYGYVLPFFLVLFTLITLFSVTNNEVFAGLTSLSILIPYYTTLFFFRHLLNKVFKFEVEENG